MKGDCNMKRFVCVVLLLCVFATSASALSLEEFNACAYSFGVPELDAATGDVRPPYTRFVSDGCTITFSEKDGRIDTIFVEGVGDSFIPYCSCALLTLDRGDDLTDNAGNLLLLYLLSRKEEEKYTLTKTGLFMMFKLSEGIYSFSVGW